MVFQRVYRSDATGLKRISWDFTDILSGLRGVLEVFEGFHDNAGVLQGIPGISEVSGLSRIYGVSEVPGSRSDSVVRRGFSRISGAFKGVLGGQDRFG